MAFQDDLDEAFAPSSDESIIRGVSQGIMLADKTLESENYLKSPLGFDVRGHMRRAGIMYRLHEMAKTGDLPYPVTMSRMPRGNWHWIEIQSKAFTSHLCRTDGPDLFPKDTPTRQDERLSNQFDLFDDHSSVIPIKGYLAWLTFGVGDSGALSHLCWGMPNASEDIWLARTNIIRRAAQNDVVVKFEPPSTRTKLEFREEWREATKSEDQDKKDMS